MSAEKNTTSRDRRRVVASCRVLSLWEKMFGRGGRPAAWKSGNGPSPPGRQQTALRQEAAESGAELPEVGAVGVAVAVEVGGRADPAEGGAERGEVGRVRV